MSAASPQTTTGDPFTTDTGQRQGDSGGDRGLRNNHNRKSTPSEAIVTIPTKINPAEILNHLAQEVAQYIVTEVRGAGYVQRALNAMQEENLL
jgi:hypothetical protein